MDDKLMTKIEAITELVNGRCDSIRSGKSVFTMNGANIVNKLSKKVLELNAMADRSWETVVEPKWYQTTDMTTCMCEVRLINPTEGEETGPFNALVNVSFEGDFSIAGVNTPVEVIRPLTKTESQQLGLAVKSKGSKPAPATKSKPENPVTGDTETPDTETGTETPDTETPGTETPSTETPDTETSNGTQAKPVSTEHIFNEYLISKDLPEEEIEAFKDWIGVATEDEMFEYLGEGEEAHQIDIEDYQNQED